MHVILCCTCVSTCVISGQMTPAEDSVQKNEGGNNVKNTRELKIKNGIIDYKKQMVQEKKKRDTIE